MNETLNVPAIEIRQGIQSIYCFAVDGKDVPRFAAVSQAHRDGGVLQGYQRPEVMSHIRAIRRYLESDGAMLPNAIVIAFDPQVTFHPSADQPTGDFSRVGQLTIPIPEVEHDKPGWLVDGQQRTAAIRDADLEAFPIAAVGFIAATTEQQRSQFILVNNSKPLPKGLIHEMLPDTVGHLPPTYARRRLPATIMIRLQVELDSPFIGRISMPTGSEGYIKDTSVLRMVEASLYEGALYQYRDPETGDGDVESMLRHLKIYWTLVKMTWPNAWELPPTKSRLTHGAGIRALGHLMDAWTENVPAADLLGMDLQARLERMRPRTAWTSGYWDLRDGETRKWNSWQNTPADVQALSALLRTPHLP